jgi:hypothetical protein
MKSMNYAGLYRKRTAFFLYLLVFFRFGLRRVHHNLLVHSARRRLSFTVFYGYSGRIYHYLP